MANNRRKVISLQDVRQTRILPLFHVCYLPKYLAGNFIVRYQKPDILRGHSLNIERKRHFKYRLLFSKSCFQHPAFQSDIFCRLTQVCLFNSDSLAEFLSRIFFFVCLFVLNKSLFRIPVCLSEFASWFVLSHFVIIIALCNTCRTL